MRKLVFYTVEYKNGEKKRYSSLVIRALTMNSEVKVIRSASGDVVWDCTMKKPTSN